MSTTAKTGNLLNLTLLYTVGNLATRIINFALVFVTTFYLTREEVGDYDLFIITLSLLTPISTLQLAEAALRWLIEDRSAEKVRETISTILTILTLSLSVVGLLFFAVNSLDLYANDVKLYILIFFQSYFIVFQQIVRGVGKNQLFVKSSILYSLVYASLAIASLLFSDSKINGLIWSNIIGSIVTCGYLFFAGGMSGYFSPEYLSKKLSIQFMAYSIPLIPNTLSWWAISSVNRYFIIYFLGKGANGLFSVSQKIPTMLLLFTGIFYQAWQEKSISMAKDKESDQYHANVYDIYIRIIFTITIGIVTTSRFLLKFIVSAEFYDSWKYTSILLLGVIFNALSSFLGTSYLSKKDTRGALTSSIAGGLVTILASWLAIPVFGLYGAGFSILAGYFVLFVLRNYDATRFYKSQFPTRLFLSFLGLFFLSSALNFFENDLIDLFNLVFSFSVLFLINREFILKLIAERREKLRFKEII